jgi:DNA modification methylase
MLQINKIYFEDCLEGMKKIDDKSVDMISNYIRINNKLYEK